MYELNTSLLREKFLIQNTDPSSEEMGSTLQALSNRFVLELSNHQGEIVETFVIRGQNMHSCVRFGARIIRAFQDRGPIMSRAEEFKWEQVWDSIVNDYEHQFNPERWIAIYNKGRCIFQGGEHHLFLDVIEKCDARNKDIYDKSITMAEEAFAQAGQRVKINHDANVALVVDLKKLQGRIGVIMRSPTRTTTFNFSIHSKGQQPLNIPQCLAASACFLEGVQLAFLLGMNTEKIRIGLIERFSKEEKQTRAASGRLARMNAEIGNLEAAYDVNYRPERPEFQHLVIEAERLAQKVLVPPEEDAEKKAEAEAGIDESANNNAETRTEDDGGIIRGEEGL